MPVSELSQSANPLNWKDHPELQLQYVADSIKKHGWAKSAIIFNANTGNIIDGHGRLQLAIKRDLTTVPVDIGWWSEDEEKELLALIDPSINMSKVDAAALDQLTTSILLQRKKHGHPNDSLIGAMTDIQGFANSIMAKRKERLIIKRAKKKARELKSISSREQVDETMDRIVTETIVRPDVMFSSKLIYNIPPLLEDRLYSKSKFLPVDTFDRSGKVLRADEYYCESSRPFGPNNESKPDGGFLGFYAEDRYIDKYYNRPDFNGQRLVDERWTAVFEPDFSTYWDWPEAVRIWAVYRSRWCVRYWQELGITCIPLLRIARDKRDYAWLYDTLPESTKILSTQLRMGGKKQWKDPEYWKHVTRCINYATSRFDLKKLIIYSDSKISRYLPSISVPVHFVMPYINKRGKYMRVRNQNLDNEARNT